MQKEYRLPLKIDNYEGVTSFFGNIKEVNDVLSNLWIDSKLYKNSSFQITVEDSINKPITNLTTTDLFNIHGNITIK